MSAASYAKMSATSFAKTKNQRKPNMTIIVTGAAGFIGSNIVKALKR